MARSAIHTAALLTTLATALLAVSVSALESNVSSNAKKLSFGAYTANILGAFSDPFEFDGSYGEPIDRIRATIFGLLIPWKTIIRDKSNEELKTLLSLIDAGKVMMHGHKGFFAGMARLKFLKEFSRAFNANAVSEDHARFRQRWLPLAETCDRLYHGPTLAELARPLIDFHLLMNIDELYSDVPNSSNNASSRYHPSDLAAIEKFIRKYANQPVFNFLKNAPGILLKIDKSLRDDAARKGKAFSLPIVGSMALLEGPDYTALSASLADSLFTRTALGLTRPTESIKSEIDKLDKNFLRSFFNNATSNEELYVFATPVGQLFFYWLYEALNLYLIAAHHLVNEVNKVKTTFALTLGDPVKRAAVLREALIKADAKVLFTQESDNQVITALTADGLFLPVDQQNQKDGTLVFLRADFWEPEYTIVPITAYKEYDKGRLTAVLATPKGSAQNVLLVSGHGSSSDASDGRDQLSAVIDTLGALKRQYGPSPILVVGMDANTKSEKDVALFKQLLERNGLISTDVGPTTVKRRMLTVQHTKSVKSAADEEDFIIVKKDQLALDKQTVGFKEQKADLRRWLPDLENQSDHYAVGAVVSEK